MYGNHPNHLPPVKETNKPNTHLLKTESGLLKARQLPCRASSSSSTLLARPAMSELGPGQRAAAGPAGGQGWRPPLLHGPGRRAASRVPRIWSRCVRSGAGLRSARGSRPPSRAPWARGGCWTCEVLIARNDRGCEGYHADPRHSSFGTCKNRSR